MDDALLPLLTGADDTGEVAVSPPSLAFCFPSRFGFFLGFRDFLELPIAWDGGDELSVAPVAGSLGLDWSDLGTAPSDVFVVDKDFPSTPRPLPPRPPPLRFLCRFLAVIAWLGVNEAGMDADAAAVAVVDDDEFSMVQTKRASRDS